MADSVEESTEGVNGKAGHSSHPTEDETIDFPEEQPQEEIPLVQHVDDVSQDLYATTGQGGRTPRTPDGSHSLTEEQDGEGSDCESRPSSTPMLSSELRDSIKHRGSVTMVNSAFKQASTKFNIKPNSGIKFLIEKNLLEDTPESIAQYLQTADGLSKRRVGEYLGKGEDHNQEVLRCFLGNYDFKGQTLDESLRAFLCDFRLPGEAQQIDRILEKFSAQYFKTNPDCGFANEDTVYILSFSLIMLNTDLHNPNIPEAKKMTLDGFLRNNQAIDDGKDLDRDLLVDLFNRIKHEEIRMNEGDQWEGEVVTFMAPNKSGWLSKMNHGGMITRWKRHWFVLSEHVLYYFDSPGQERPRFILPMDDVRVGRGKDGLTLNILGASGNRIKCTKCYDNGNMELQNFKDFTMKASNVREREEWYEALRDELEQDPVKKMQRIQSTKKKDQMRVIKPGALKQSNDGKDEHRLNDVHLLELPKPVAAGWMSKRGETNKGWKRRYVALIDPPEEIGLGIALYYFASEQLMNRMIEIGEQTQKGQLFLEHVKKVNVQQDKSDNQAIIQLLCEGRNWTFRPEGAQDFGFWTETLQRYVEKAHVQGDKRRRDLAASIQGPNKGLMVAAVFRHASLGMQLANQPPMDCGVTPGIVGVYVSKLEPEGDAEAQGIKVGDRIFMIGSKEVPSSLFHKHVAARIKAAGRPVQILFERCLEGARDSMSVADGRRSQSMPPELVDQSLSRSQSAGEIAAGSQQGIGARHRPSSKSVR